MAFWLKTREKTGHRDSHRVTAAQTGHSGGPVHPALIGNSELFNISSGEKKVLLGVGGLETLVDLDLDKNAT